MIDKESAELLQFISRTGITSEPEIMVEKGKHMDYPGMVRHLKALESEGLVRRVPNFFKGLGDALEMTRKGYQSL